MLKELPLLLWCLWLLATSVGGHGESGSTLQHVDDKKMTAKDSLPEDANFKIRHQSHRRHYENEHKSHHHDHRWGPYFEEEQNSTALTVPVGGSVHLNCRVGMLHDKTVMWLRRSGDRVSLLTVGQNRYSSDARVELKFQYPNNWKLHISPIQKHDQGLYLCQVSTHPPKVLYTNVTVLAPELQIVDEHGHKVHDRYYKTGSTIELTCRVRHVHTPSHVIWMKDTRPLPSKVTTTGISDSITGATVSRLVIPRAVKDDTGTYSCSISKFSMVEVHVHVLNGEKQAAVQHDTWVTAKASTRGGDALLVLMVALFQHAMG